MTAKPPTLWQLGWISLKVGITCFGGPYALLGYYEREFVAKNGWLTSREFWHGVAIGQLTPGPVAFATLVHCAYRLRKIPGAVIAALGNLLPSFVLTLVFGYFYVFLEHSSALKQSLTFITAVVAGLLSSVVWQGHKTFFSTKAQILIGITCLAALLLVPKANAILFLLAAGIFGALAMAPKKNPP